MSDAGDLFDQYAAAYEQALSAALAPAGKAGNISPRGALRGSNAVWTKRSKHRKLYWTLVAAMARRRLCCLRR